MSSAILYLAIVAIWAVVLIPRWLRRDHVAGEDLSQAEPDGEAAIPPAREEAPQAHREAPRARPAAAQGRRPAGEAGAGEAGAGAPAPGDDPRDLERKRVLASRRRLLAMLLILAAGSAALAVTAMAAWWVIVPPAVMLLGYLALLREAAKADAERRQVVRAVPASASAAPARTGAIQARATATPARGVPAASPARGVPAGPPAPGAEVIDISASLGQGGEELYDQYADAKLRAVGDLPCFPAAWPSRQPPRHHRQRRAPVIGVVFGSGVTCGDPGPQKLPRCENPPQSRISE